MCAKGLLSGHKIAGVKFRILDGMHHCVDSSEFAFFQAAQGAVRDVFETGSWRLLEPIMLVEVVGPQEFQVTLPMQFISQLYIIYHFITIITVFI